MESVLRISAKDFDVDEFLSGFPQLHAASVWRAGEPRLPTGRNEDSGFTVVVAFGAEWVHVRDRALASIGALRRVLSEAHSVGAAIALDFAMGVGGERSFTSTASFSPDNLNTLHDVGATLLVSAYPISEKDSVSRPASRKGGVGAESRRGGKSAKGPRKLRRRTRRR